MLQPSIQFLGALGQFSLKLPRYLFNILLFTLRVLNPYQQGRVRINKASMRTLVNQLVFSGVDALPVISLLGIASGLAITAQVILTIQLIGERTEVIDILTRVVVYELSALLTAIVLIGRSGSAITVDLGNMKLNRELEGLEMLGMNLNRFLVTPRVVGTAVAQMILSIYFAFFSIASGVLFLAYTENPGYLNYLTDIANALHPKDLTLYLIKNLMFGALIGSIASYHALQVQHSRTELPQQTQRAIVNSLSIIFVLNALFILAMQASFL